MQEVGAAMSLTLSEHNTEASLIFDRKDQEEEA